MRLTPHHNIIFYDIAPDIQPAIQKILNRCGIVSDPNTIEPLVRYAMACPALPTCGLAITESERAIPGILQRIRTLLDKLGLQDEHFVVRMTGCPNGCARPYMAELGFVGSGPESYQVWLGGSPDQTRLAQPYTERLHDNDIESFLEPMFVYFDKSRNSGESFGDFCDRLGFDALREFASNYEPGSLTNQATQPKRSPSRSRHRISLHDEIYEKLKAAATSQGQPMTNLVNQALEEYLQKLS